MYSGFKAAALAIYITESTSREEHTAQQGMEQARGGSEKFTN
jgi:hypothetical protein